MAFAVIVDQITENLAVLLVEIDGEEQKVKFPLQLLPQKVKEGDILNFSIDIDENKTQKKKAQAAEILSKLLKNSDK